MEIIEKKHQLNPNPQENEICEKNSRMEYVLDMDGRELGYGPCNHVTWDDRKLYIYRGHGFSSTIILECPLTEISHLEVIENFVCICFNEE